MSDTMRRILGVAMIVLAVVAFLPFMPVVFGYVRADVRQDSAATYFPTASATPTLRYINCVQVPGQLELVANDKNAKKSYYIKCMNNWVSAVALRVSVSNANATGLTWSSTTYSTTADVPPGDYYCFPVGRISGQGNLTDNNNSGLMKVVYRAEVNPVNPTYDLYADTQFVGSLNFTNAPPAQTITCP